MEQLPAQSSHAYSTRQSTSSHGLCKSETSGVTPPLIAATFSPLNHTSHHVDQAPKNVAFELYLSDVPNYRARLPMRVQIFPHDTTDSIVTTVKNFYGLYQDRGGVKGVSFQDESGSTLIARYENFVNNMIVTVRVELDPDALGAAARAPSYNSASPASANHGYCGAGQYRPVPPQPAEILNYGQPMSRSASPRDRSLSPHSAGGKRGDSTNTALLPPKMIRSRSGPKSRGSSILGGRVDSIGDFTNGYYSSDGGDASAGGSRKAKSDLADISVDNIVEGGRRKRAKFTSSELPLFVPPQVPLATSSSSMSPARRMNGHGLPPSFPHSGQRPYIYPPPLHSPQSMGHVDLGHGYSIHNQPPSAPHHTHHLRNRNNGPLTPAALQLARGFPIPPLGILPTPDPTIASCISDEDVAIQLMRLGDTSNISNGTRHSGSTLDDAFSGVADAASSSNGDNDSGMDSDDSQRSTLPPKDEYSPAGSSSITPPPPTRKRQKKTDGSSTSYHGTDNEEVSHTDRCDVDTNLDLLPQEFLDELDSVLQPAATATAKKQSSIVSKAKETNEAKNSKPIKPRSTAGKKKSKPAMLATATSKPSPISPGILPPPSRKASVSSALNFQHQFGADEEDLSSKPRCQRCRKSKKGCDRQRPCQRCKDAGIGIEGCISEDEGNGRKGRFGRHMGVPVKKVPEATTHGQESSTAGLSGPIPLSTSTEGTAEKSKKRKR
ncbi:MAG: hypothetical protein M1829_002854 [Trizodia sp. TS-e1964]|nr:MAG: hypothetical protein M1829_002854 [Trizodia sp. TS-e1964]